jgi:hypothetical protein
MQPFGCGLVAYPETERLYGVPFLTRQRGVDW